MLQLTELGNRLREAREANGLSLDDLQEITKIQKRYLVGIEEGKYEMMPGKFYVRAFIKQYAEAVGLEPEEIFEQYKNDIPSVHNDELPQLSRVQTRKTLGPTNSKILDMLPKLFLAIFIIGAAVFIWVWFSKNMGTSTESPDQEQTESVILKEKDDSPLNKNEESTQSEETDKNEKTDIEEKEEAEPVSSQELTVLGTEGRKTTYELKNTDQFKLKVLSKGETWIDIKNGKNYSFFQGILKENESQEVDFTNEDVAEIVVGRALDTEIYVNDQKLEFVIDPNKTVRQDIVIQFVKTQTQ
ncbi:helix-turn-helix domain-containing protein [Peribacillus tepidiphilus]|uniref:helix-turn-helix domain-containing protein n=1 Tax=Peribacillus tepidiphilus TaxID=2652445 RepID=UPI0030B83DB7